MARPLINEFNSLGVSYEVIGGGRINHTINHIKIYGFSYGFPWKNGESKHYVTADLLKIAYSNCKKIEFSDEGY